MTKEERLLIPRIKVINTYPFNDHFMLNEIIELNEFDGRAHLSKNMQEWYVSKNPLSSAGHKHPITMYESTFNLYPHLFQKLEWWQERDIYNMGIYLKYKDSFGNGETIVVKSSSLEKVTNKHDDFYGEYFLGSYHIGCLELATETEYNLYITNKKQ